MMQRSPGKESFSEFPPMPEEGSLRASIYRMARKKNCSASVARTVAEAAVLRCRELVNRLGISLSPSVNHNNR